MGFKARRPAVVAGHFTAVRRVDALVLAAYPAGLT
jgi:hypothetical protein